MLKMLIPKIKIFIYLLSPMIVQLINNITLLDVENHQFPTLIITYWLNIKRQRMNKEHYTLSKLQTQS